MTTTDLNRAKEVLNLNEIVAIPTETVYGLAGNAFNESAIEKIFSLKNRPLFNPLIVHIKSADYLNQIAEKVPDKAFQLAAHFWPGPLTLVLKKRSNIPDIVTAGKDSVAIRVPNHPLTLELLKQLDFPLAAPSANPFGSISPTSAEHVARYFGDNLKVILDGGQCEQGIESTIIGFKNEVPILYRLGAISLEKLERVIGPIHAETSNNLSPDAPGMLSKHYAPKTPTYLTNNVEELCKAFPDKKIGVLIFQDKISNTNSAQQEQLSATGDLREAATNLYAAMHRLDENSLDLIIAEKLPDFDLGKVINDRLEKASKNK